MEEAHEPVVGLGWLAAVAAPWAVAPHPNFPETEIEASRALALVSEFRHYDIKKNLERLPSDTPTWAAQLTKDAKDSLYLETQSAAIARLEATARKAQLPYGARAAAALYAAIGMAEVGESRGAIELLRSLARRGRLGASRTNPSARLVTAVLELQIAMRYVEIGEFKGARAHLDASRRALEGLKSSQCEAFEVSRGISWRSPRIVADIVEATDSNQRRLAGRIEGWQGNLWIEIVRARPAWVDVRIRSQAATRDRRVANQAFEARAAVGRSRVVIGGEDPPGVIPAYSALISAELAGNLSEVHASREALAQLLLLNQPSSHQMFEALRLMVRANSKEGLRAAVSLCRTEGPLGALVAVVANTLVSAEALKTVSTQELRLIEGAYDLVPDRNLRTALALTERYLQAAAADKRSVEEVGLAVRTIAKIVGRTGATGALLLRVLAAIQEGKTPPFSIAREVVQLAETVDWEAVPGRARTRWEEWARSLAGDSDTSEVGAAILSTLGTEDRSVASETVLMADVVNFLNRDPGTSYPKSYVDRVVQYCADELERVRSESRSGSYSVGSYDQGEIAVLTALDTHSTALWSTIASFVVDPEVSANHKAAAVDRLAKLAGSIPKGVRTELSQHWPAYSSQKKRQSAFSFENLEEFPEALRLGAAIHASDGHELAGRIMAMAGSANPTLRTEAAITTGAVMKSVAASTWGHVLLVQLTRDPDLEVRSAAARVLAESAAQESEMHRIVQDRVLEILNSDSVRQPLYALHGLQALAAEANPRRLLAPFADAVIALARDHPSSVVRGAAAIVASDLAEAERPNPS